MTQTTPSHSQAVEAAVQRLMQIADQFALYYPEKTGWSAQAQKTDRANFEAELRAALTSQQEVAAPAGDASLRDQIKNLERIKNDLQTRLFKALQTAPTLKAALQEVDHTPSGSLSRSLYSDVLDIACVHIARVKELEAEIAASRVPAASLASREQGVEAVGMVPGKQDQSNLAVAESDPVQGVEPVARDREADRRRFPDADFNRWLDESVTENGEFSVWDLIPSVGSAWNGWNNRALYTAPPSSKTQDDLFALVKATCEKHHIRFVNRSYGQCSTDTVSLDTFVDIVTAVIASQPKAPAPVPVVQGEATETMRRHVEDFARRHGWTPESGEGAFECVQRLCYAQGRKDATPANIVVGAGGDVWASVVTEDEVAMLLPWFESGVNTLQLRAALQEFADSRCPSTTPTPEQPTTGSGQVVTDAERYQWLRNIADPDAEDTGIAVSETYLNDWGKFCTRYFAGDELDKAIDAAILSTASPAGEGEGKS